MIAKGQTGSLKFDGQFVTIERKGFLAATTQGRGTKRIPITQITAVQFNPAKAITRGYISFTISGGQELKSKVGRQSFDAFNDENSLTFLAGASKNFEAIRDAIEAAMLGTQPGSQTGSQTAELTQIAALHAQGVLSDEEFKAAKQQLLGL